MNKRIISSDIGFIIVGFSIYVFIFQIKYNNAVRSIDSKINESMRISHSINFVDSLIHVIQKDSSKQKWDELKASIFKEFNGEIKSIYPSLPDNKGIIIDSINQLINKIDYHFESNSSELSSLIYDLQIDVLELQKYYLKLHNYQLEKYANERSDIKLLKILSVGLFILGLVILILINKERLKMH